MLELCIQDETSKLKCVVLGIADDFGGTPKLEDAYDPKSIEHILSGTYPQEDDMVSEIYGFKKVLEKHGVKVYQPRNIPNCNQIFSRDVAFVVEDTLIRSNILPHREREISAFDEIMNLIPNDKIIIPPKEVHIEGGDVIIWKEYIFIGTYLREDYSGQITARTNKSAVEFIRSLFPYKKVIAFDLVKSENPYKNALHLDCCFQPVGTDKAILHPEGFYNNSDVNLIEDIFGRENIFYATEKEMYDMTCNVFSISPTVVVSEIKFKRLNSWLEKGGISIEAIPYGEISKQEGLLRCSTLPLVRE